MRFKLFENFNIEKEVVKYFFDLRKSDKPKQSNISFQDIYKKYNESKNDFPVDDECDSGYDVYDEILDIVKKQKDTITLYRAMDISNNISDIEKVYKTIPYYSGIGEYWSFDKNTYPMDNSSIDFSDDIDNSLQILIKAEVTPDTINWDNTFKHSVSMYSGENEITLNEGSVYVTVVGIFDDMGINIISDININDYIKI